MVAVLTTALAAAIALASAAPSPAGDLPMRCLVEHELAHAGGWPAWHPGAVLRRGCGHLPMPPRRYRIHGKPVIHRVPPEEIFSHCGYALACSDIGGARPNVWLPDRRRRAR